MHHHHHLLLTSTAELASRSCCCCCWPRRAASAGVVGWAHEGDTRRRRRRRRRKKQAVREHCMLTGTLMTLSWLCWQHHHLLLLVVLLRPLRYVCTRAADTHLDWRAFACITVCQLSECSAVHLCRPVAVACVSQRVCIWARCRRAVQVPLQVHVAQGSLNRRAAALLQENHTAWQHTPDHQAPPHLGDLIGHCRLAPAAAPPAAGCNDAALPAEAREDASLLLLLLILLLCCCMGLLCWITGFPAAACGERAFVSGVLLPGRPATAKAGENESEISLCAPAACRGRIRPWAYVKMLCTP